MIVGPGLADGDLACGSEVQESVFPGRICEGSAPIVRESLHWVSGRVACRYQTNDVPVCRCPPRDAIAKRGSRLC